MFFVFHTSVHVDHLQACHASEQIQQQVSSSPYSDHSVQSDRLCVDPNSVKVQQHKNSTKKDIKKWSCSDSRETIPLAHECARNGAIKIVSTLCNYLIKIVINCLRK